MEQNNQIEDVFAGLSEKNVGNPVKTPNVGEPVVMSPISEDSLPKKNVLSEVVFWTIIIIIVVIGAFFVRMFLSK